jgi:hypothetical protein
MSTEIAEIKGTCHSNYLKDEFTPETEDATLYLTRFYNGGDKGSEIQLTVSANNTYGTSYIHLNREQCKELAQILNDCFDYDKYPSE